MNKNTRKFSVRRTIFGLFVFFSVFLTTNSTEEERRDVSHHEKQLYRYFRSTSELKWIGEVIPYCRFLCPVGYFVVTEHVKTEEILLESLDCGKFEAEILFCNCGSRPPVRTYLRISMYMQFVSGLHGEIYEVVRRASEKCHTSNAWTVYKRVDKDDDTFRQLFRVCLIRLIWKLVRSIRIPGYKNCITYDTDDDDVEPDFKE